MRDKNEHQWEKLTKVKSTPQGSGGTNLAEILPKLNEVLKVTGFQLNPLGPIPTTAQQPKGEVTLSDMFQKMTEVFLPDKAAGFDGLIQFDIANDEPQALYIKDSKVEIKAEKGSNPACTITTDKDSMLEMLHGKADPTKLFMIVLPILVFSVFSNK